MGPPGGGGGGGGIGPPGGGGGGTAPEASIVGISLPLSPLTTTGRLMSCWKRVHYQCNE